MDEIRNQRTVSARIDGPPELAVRLVSALLALAVAGVHVADQGGVTAFNSPDWLGWGFRAIEVGGVLTALVLLMPWSAWLGWAAGVLLGAGPFLGYLATRSAGVPGDHQDIGNWGYWLGTDSLIVEAALVVLSAGMLLPWAAALAAGFRRRRAGGLRLGPGVPANSLQATAVKGEHSTVQPAYR
jgi:hypothetical protein